jgi:hypothetical protein
VAEIEAAAEALLARDAISADAPLIGAGCGRFIALQVAQRLGRPYYDFAELIDCAPTARELAAVCAPAVSVGLLAERALLLAAMFGRWR